MSRFAIIALVALFSVAAVAEELAAPPAEGQGRLTVGGRDASSILMKITTRDDDEGQGYCEPGDLGTGASGGTAANNWEDADTCSADTDCDTTGGLGNCIAAKLGSARRAWLTGNQGYCCTSVNGDGTCGTWESPKVACTLHQGVSWVDPDAGCTGGDATCVYDYVPRNVIPDVGGTVALDSRLGEWGPKMTYHGHLAPAKSGYPSGLIFVDNELRANGKVQEMIFRGLQVHGLSGANNDWIKAPTNCTSIDAFSISIPDSAPEQNAGIYIDYSFITGGLDETNEIKNTAEYTIQTSVIAGAPRLNGYCTQADTGCSGTCPPPAPIRYLCETTTDCTDQGWTNSTCDFTINGCPSYLMIHHSDTSGSILDNVFAFFTARGPRITEQGDADHVDVINNLIYGTDEQSGGSPKNDLPMTLGDGGGSCASANVIGNVYRPGPEQVSDTSNEIHNMGLIKDDASCTIPSSNSHELYLDDNIVEYGGSGSSFIGACKTTTTFAGYMCTQDDDCEVVGALAGDCEASDCVSGCDGIEPFWDSSGAAEVAKHDTTGITIAAASTVADARVGASRKSGPWYPQESSQLAYVLDSAADGDAGTPYTCPDFPCSGIYCPDGSAGQGASPELWDVGRASTGVAGITPLPNCRNSTRDAVYDLDTYASGSCVSGGAACNCDATATVSSGTCASTDCTGDCAVSLVIDTDVDGIDDVWESANCGGDCDPNSTTDCNGWADASGNNHYSCLEVYSYDRLSEMVAPATGNIVGALATGAQFQ